MKRYFLIACEIMFREVCYCCSKCNSIVDIKFMPKKLHDIGSAKMKELIQKEIDFVDCDKYDAILLCYGLCNNGTLGLHSPLPLVVPRAHDCITLLMGSKSMYKEYFYNNPGTFFKSTGWIERDINPNDTEDSITRQLGIDKTKDEYIELYGEEEGEYLYEMLGSWTSNYQQITYIDTKIGEFNDYKEIAKKQADDNMWKYDEFCGDTKLILDLLDGRWNEDDFLIVPPNHVTCATNDSEIISFI